MRGVAVKAFIGAAHRLLAEHHAQRMVAEHLAVGGGVGSGQLDILAAGTLQDTFGVARVRTPVADTLAERAFEHVVRLEHEAFDGLPLQVHAGLRAELFLPLVFTVAEGVPERVGVGVLGDLLVVLAVLVVERSPRTDDQTAEERVGIVQRLHLGIVVLGVSDVHAGSDVEGAGELIIGVHAAGETLVAGRIGNALVVLVGHGGVETAPVGTGLRVHLVFLQLAHAGHLFDPVGHREVRRTGIVVIVDVPAGVGVGDFVEVVQFRTGHHAEAIVVGQLADTVLGAGAEGGFAGFTGLGGHEDDAVRSAGAVDGGGCRVFQDGQALDIVRVDGGDGVVRVGEVGLVTGHHRNTVHDPQRLVAGVDGGCTADTDLRVGTRLAGFGGDGDAGHLTGQHLVDGRCRDGGDLVGLDGRDGAGLRLAAGRTVTDHDHVFQILSVGSKCAVDDGTSVDGDFLRLVADETEQQGRVGRCVEGIGTVEARSRAGRGAFHRDGRKCHRFSRACISHSTPDGDVLRVKRENHQQGCQN